MLTSSDMQSDHDTESIAGAAQIEDETDAMNVDQLTTEHGNAIEWPPIRTRHTKIWLEQMYPTISWMLVPQTPPSQAVAGEPSEISPVFPSFTAVQITPALPATTQMFSGTPIWIPGTPESPQRTYGQMTSQHANIRIHGTPQDHTQAVQSMVVPFGSNPNIEASAHRPAINVVLCGFHGCILDQSNKTCFAAVTNGTNRYHLANEYAERGWGFCSDVEPGQTTALTTANQIHSFEPSPLKLKAMQDGVIQFLPGIDLSEVELSLELDEMYGTKEDIETAIFEHHKVMDKLGRILGTIHGPGQVWPCIWLDNEVIWLARRSEDLVAV